MSLQIRSLLENYFQQEERKVDWSLIEQDYALSWMIYGISQVPILAEHLVFKGGTCLKKCYFGEYRFSQDLDFSVTAGCPQGDDLENLIEEATLIAEKRMRGNGSNVEFTSKRYIEKRPHPDNQEAFTIMIQYPWQRKPLTRIMVEVTLSEVVYISPQRKALIHSYDEILECELKTYCLEEIIAEKISALLSFSKKLHERGWGRTRARDYSREESH